MAFRRESLGNLAAPNALYVRGFTDLFEIPRSFYAGKRLLGVGCGPRGSLEWAEHAAERIDLEPLADEYVRLHERRQAMTYVQRVCERIPFGDDLDAAVAEITRVTRPGGMLLLLVDVNHEPTPTEPHRIDRTFLGRFDGFRVLERRDYKRHSDNMYDNVFMAGDTYSHDSGGDAPGVLTARLERI